MSNYKRVIPRDLFNESALLRDIGKLWLCLEKLSLKNIEILPEQVDFFDIVQDYSSGNISVKNIDFLIDNKKYVLERPLNSRDAFPLRVKIPEDELTEDMDDDSYEVFTDDGKLSEDMKKLLKI